MSCDLPHPSSPASGPEPNVERTGLADKYGIRRRHALHVTVYTAVYTDMENSGHLGPCASEEPQPKTSSMRTMRAALSTQVLFSPQLPKLFANETLYQLSYTPRTHRFEIAKNRQEANRESNSPKTMTDEHNLIVAALITKSAGLLRREGHWMTAISDEIQRGYLTTS